MASTKFKVVFQFFIIMVFDLQINQSKRYHEYFCRSSWQLGEIFGINSTVELRKSISKLLATTHKPYLRVLYTTQSIPTPGTYYIHNVKGEKGVPGSKGSAIHRCPNPKPPPPRRSMFRNHVAWLHAQWWMVQQQETPLTSTAQALPVIHESGNDDALGQAVLKTWRREKDQ